MIVQLRQKLSIDSISLSMDDQLFNITQLTFPAVTVYEKLENSHDSGWMNEAGIRLNIFDLNAQYANEHVQLRLSI